MASNTENTAAIQAILASKVEVSELTVDERREVKDGVFPFGVRINYRDPMIIIGDKIEGEGEPSINGGGEFKGVSLVNGSITSEADFTADANLQT